VLNSLLHRLPRFYSHECFVFISPEDIRLTRRPIENFRFARRRFRTAKYSCELQKPTTSDDLCLVGQLPLTFSEDVCLPRHHSEILEFQTRYLEVQKIRMSGSEAGQEDERKK
jgi:hypothetical protein